MGFFDDVAGIIGDLNNLRTEAQDAVVQIREEALGLKEEAISTTANLKQEALDAAAGLQDQAMSVRNDLSVGVGDLAADLGLAHGVDDAVSSIEPQNDGGGDTRT